MLLNMDLGFDSLIKSYKEIRFHVNSHKTKKIHFDDTGVLTENHTLKIIQVF